MKEMKFPTQIDKIKKRLLDIDPEKYQSSRNYGEGKLTYLSPYISRGVLSTRQVFEHIKTLELPWYKIEKLVQELAWRDYWQLVWIEKGKEINTDLKNSQEPVSNHQLPKAIVDASCGIQSVDEAIQALYKTGYMHNHMRMYVASICCNIANSHWLQPAKWMYAQLLDGDLASNQLSWQWVAGAFASKKYYANQDNINKYFHASQKNTFLDIEYEEMDALETPAVLRELVSFELETPLPKIERPVLQRNKTTLIYNYYNMDPYWHEGEDLQRILLLEPSLFKENPVQQNCIDFLLGLTENIPGIEVFVGEFEELAAELSSEHLVYKEHPLNKHYKGKEEARDWMSNVSGYYPSFFAFWKRCKKELKK